MKCLRCKKKKVTNKKRGLCGKCYSRLYYSKQLDLYPVNLSLWIKERYKPSLIKDLRSMKENNYTLQNIGDKYGFTREYARQLYKVICGTKYTELVKERSLKNMEKKKEFEEKKKTTDFKLLSYKKGSFVYKHVVAENKFIIECKKYKLEPKNISPGLFLVGKKIVHFVSSYVPKYKTKKGVGVYHFNLTKREKADIIVCYIHPNKFFTLPHVTTDAIYIPDKNTGKSPYWNNHGLWLLT